MHKPQRSVHAVLRDVTLSLGAAAEEPGTAVGLPLVRGLVRSADVQCLVQRLALRGRRRAQHEPQV